MAYLYRSRLHAIWHGYYGLHGYPSVLWGDISTFMFQLGLASPAKVM